MKFRYIKKYARQMHQAGKKGMRKYPEGVRKSIRKELAVNYSSVFVRIFSGLCYLAQTDNICVFTFTLKHRLASMEYFKKNTAEKPGNA